VSGELTLRQRSILVSATASTLGDSYCSLAWGTRLAGEAGAEVAGGVLRGDDTRLEPAERTLAAWARAVARNPNGTTEDDVQALRDAGFDDRQIFAMTLFVALRVAFATVNDALGSRPDRPLAAAAPAAVRDAVTYGRPVASGGPEPPPSSPSDLRSSAMSSDALDAAAGARWRTSAAGATAAGLVALLIVFAGIGYLSLPEPQRPFSPPDEVLRSVADGAVALPALLWVLALQGVAGLGAVWVISRRVGREDSDLPWWAALVGLLGFGGLALAAAASLERLPQLVALYDEAGFGEGDVIGAAWPPVMEPGGLLFCGAVGLWVLWVSLESLAGRVGPRTGAVLGLVLAAALLVAAGGAAAGDSGVWGTMTVFATLFGAAWFAFWAWLLQRDED
jgi:hypothetical protein